MRKERKKKEEEDQFVCKLIDSSKTSRTNLSIDGSKTIDVKTFSGSRTSKTRAALASVAGGEGR
jgi:hypothetical protein